MVYALTYTNKWNIEEIPEGTLKYMGRTRTMITKYKEGVGHYGTIYSPHQLFTSREAVQRWINWEVPKDGDYYIVER